MNAERLHALALAIRDDLKATDEVTLLNALAQSLRGQRDEPTDPNHGVDVGRYRTKLEVALASAPSNRLSPAWRQSLVDLRVAGLLGQELLSRLNVIFGRNELTIGNAAAEVTGLAERVQNLSRALEALLLGFEKFSIGAEDLAPGEFEVGFLIPRAAVNNQLGDLGEEFVHINKQILLPIAELATGTREAIRLRTISSSGFQAFLVAVPEVARLLSEILESLLRSYDSYREIKDYYTGLVETRLSDDALAPLRAEVTQYMQVDVQALTEKLLDDYGDRLVDGGRVNELRVEIRRSLTETTRRIDEGYSIEVRSYRLPQAEDDEELPLGATTETEEVRRIIEDRQPRMQGLNTGGVSILELPVAGEPPDEGHSANAHA